MPPGVRLPRGDPINIRILACHATAMRPQEQPHPTCRIEPGSLRRGLFDLLRHVEAEPFCLMPGSPPSPRATLCGTSPPRSRHTPEGPLEREGPTLLSGSIPRCGFRNSICRQITSISAINAVPNPWCLLCLWISKSTTRGHMISVSSGGHALGAASMRCGITENPSQVKSRRPVRHSPVRNPWRIWPPRSRSLRDICNTGRTNGMIRPIRRLLPSCSRSSLC